MNTAFSTSISGMRTSMARFEASASRVATGAGVSRGNVDLASEAVDQMSAKTGFQANARVLQASLDMQRTALELWA